MSSGEYESFHARSLHQRDAFWTEQARLIEWQQSFTRVCDYDEPPFANWFVGGRTNLCFNAVDRHLKERGSQEALIFVSTETNEERIFSFAQLHAEVRRMAAVLRELGVEKGDRVLIYMPMIPEAVFAMLACARIGAIHSVVFGGFASHSLAARIDDAKPKVIVSADAGSRAGKLIPYKPLLDHALECAEHMVDKVLLVNRGLVSFERVLGRDEDYASLGAKHADADVPIEWVESTHPSYTLYTSGTTGKPKGVQRDTGGYAVALAASMKHIFRGRAGETFFSTSDIGWVVGHSYIVYGPLLAGMATIVYEGLPIRPDPAIWWRLVEKYRVSVMFTSPTALRVLKKHDQAYLQRHDLSSLRALFIAGEPLDEPTANWATAALGKPVLDNYWQTETGWPILATYNGAESDGAEAATSKPGSPGRAVYGYDLKLLDEATGEEITSADQKGVLVIEGPLPPGCLQTIWGDDERFVRTYWNSIPGKLVYNTFDWGVRDADGYYYILGRTDDVINVAGHRLGTREIEESICSHPNVAEVAVVGIRDALKGEVAVALAVLKDASKVATSDARAEHEREAMRRVEEQLGAVARPARVYFVNQLPKTRSGKLLRRAIRAICEHRDAGDLTTIEDPAALEHIAEVVQASE